MLQQQEFQEKLFRKEQRRAYIQKRREALKRERSAMGDMADPIMLMLGMAARGQMWKNPFV